MSPQQQLQLLNKLTVTQLAELSKLSKPYISQVKNGKRPPSRRLLDTLQKFLVERNNIHGDYLTLFLQSRRANEVSSGSIHFYKVKLGKFFDELNVDKTNQRQIERFLLQFTNSGNRHAYYRAIKTFYRWREDNFALPNPMRHMRAPKLSKLIMPSLTQEEVVTLIDALHNARDKAIIALFTESGLRLSELMNIKLKDIDWEGHTIRIIGKGKKEAFAPFGDLTEYYMKQWLAQFQPNSNIWGVNQWGIISMLRRLEDSTGLTCNPHTFRRTFACLLRKAGVDTMTIKDLGRWESLEMVQRYTRSVTFEDSMKHYKAPLG